MSDAPQSQLILYRTPDGQTRIQCRFENENVWLTQELMAAARRRAELEVQGEADLLNLLDTEVKKLPKRNRRGKK